MVKKEELLERGTGLLFQGKAEEAEKLLRRELEEHGSDPDVLALLGRVLQERKKLREAEDGYRAALREDGGHAGAARGLASILAATGRADEAVVLLRNLVEKGKGDAAVWRDLGIALCRKAAETEDLEERRRFYAEGGEALERALALGGWDAATVLSLAGSLAAREERGKTLALLEGALSKIEEPLADRLRILGDLLLYQVMWDRFGEAEKTARTLAREGAAEPVLLRRVATDLARQARAMALSSPEWKKRAARLADLLEGMVQ